MQFLKSEIREEIVCAARKLFLKNGYEKTSMKAIAEAAGITVGNIYRYFKGKETLLTYILKPIEEYIESFIDKIELSEERANYRLLLDEFIDLIVSMCENHNEGLNILFNCAEQGESVRYKDRLLANMSKRLEETICKSSSPGVDGLMNSTITASVMEGIYSIINRCYHSSDLLKKQLKLFTAFMCSDMDRRLTEAYRLSAGGM